MKVNVSFDRCFRVFAPLFVVITFSACSTPQRYSDDTQYLDQPKKAAAKYSTADHRVATQHRKPKYKPAPTEPVASENSNVASKAHQKQKPATPAPAASEKVKLEGDDVKLEGTKQ